METFVTFLLPLKLKTNEHHVDWPDQGQFGQLESIFLVTLSLSTNHGLHCVMSSLGQPLSVALFIDSCDEFVDLHLVHVLLYCVSLSLSLRSSGFCIRVTWIRCSGWVVKGLGGL